MIFRCLVVSGSGDNPCGLAGLGLSGEGPVAVSLGTSDTVMGITKEPRPQEEVWQFQNASLGL